MKKTSLTSKIPTPIRDSLAKDPFMSKCCIADEHCSGRIEFHHNFIYAGKRINELWSILPVCHYHHSKADYRNYKEKLNWQMIQRIKDMGEVIMKYARFNWTALMCYLSTRDFATKKNEE